MIHQFYFDIFVAHLAFYLPLFIAYMSANVQFGVLEYFLLDEFAMFIFIHFPLLEMEGSVILLHEDWSAGSLLFLEHSAEVFAVAVVFASVHLLLILSSYFINFITVGALLSSIRLILSGSEGKDAT